MTIAMKALPCEAIERPPMRGNPCATHRVNSQVKEPLSSLKTTARAQQRRTSALRNYVNNNDGPPLSATTTTTTEINNTNAYNMDINNIKTPLLQRTRNRDTRSRTPHTLSRTLVIPPSHPLIKKKKPDNDLVWLFTAPYYRALDGISNENPVDRRQRGAD